MPWLTITVDVPEELKDSFVGEFSRDRILGVWEKPAPGDQRIELVLYFDEARKPLLVEARVDRLFERNGYPVSEALFGIQEQEDWTREWRKGYTSSSEIVFKSFPVGRRPKTPMPGRSCWALTSALPLEPGPMKTRS
jgi:hypothetical protein